MRVQAKNVLIMSLRHTLVLLIGAFLGYYSSNILLVGVPRSAEQHAGTVEASWQAVALQTGTDKSGNPHVEPCFSNKLHCNNYSAMYEEFLTPYRSLPAKILEIGLGCDMIYGPGKSLDLWTRYFTNPLVEITFIELDAQCVQRFGEQIYKNGKKVSVVAGDQANVSLLAEVTRRYGPFDVVIDDGGHTFHQQRTCIEFFLNTGLKSSGLLFIEDLHTSFLWKPDVAGADRVNFAFRQLSDVLLSSGLPDKRYTPTDKTVLNVARFVRWFGCQRRACFIRKT
ncbi:hypothetical protein CYMTET_3667 [Cymbomonas tetramitiformis]|uniref:Uncharacterized protein n=1 Tax=Cymbomonas tetramitiformis TaxID=36881 RepID=A0AAE0LKT9_9CHLO|nr:hypothetical protein CYMTET_3667 [Cymbomonas tetramitiformis]|eukprot:gene19311-23084_t